MPALWGIPEHQGGLTGDAQTRRGRDGETGRRGEPRTRHSALRTRNPESITHSSLATGRAKLRLLCFPILPWAQMRPPWASTSVLAT